MIVCVSAYQLAPIPVTWETQNMTQLSVFLVLSFLTLVISSRRTLFRSSQRRTDEILPRPVRVPDCGLWCGPSKYPDEQVIQILSRNESINQFLDQDQSVFLNKKSFTISNYENICEEQIGYIYPKAAKNRKGEFMFIVNNPGGSSKHRQKVTVKTCSRPDEECVNKILILIASPPSS